MRLIDLDDYRHCFCGNDGEYEKWNIDPDIFVDPDTLIQPEEKKGYWLPVEDERVSGICSVCGWTSYLYADDVVGMDYCPNCGARLEEQ